MSKKVAFLCEAETERRRALAESLKAEGFEPVAVERPEGLRPPAEVATIFVVSVGPGRETRETLWSWRRLAAVSRAPLVAVVRSGDEEGTRLAWDAGADEVISWPAARIELGGRLRLAASLASLRNEVVEYGRVLNSVVRALEDRVPYTSGHSQRMGELAAAMAQELDFPAEEVERVRQASWIHNLGEVAVSERILWGESRLTPDEEAHIRRHPRLGFELLQGLPSMAPFLPFLLHHHERLDGSGYPDGLAGGEIPRPVQLVSLADAYDALTSPRPYRPARSHTAAMQILLGEARQGLWADELLEALERAARRLGLPEAAPGTA